jgi:DNA-binding beta-propeller fold protein YncE
MFPNKGRGRAALALAVAAIGLASAAPAHAPAADGRALELVTPTQPGPIVSNVVGVSPDGGAIVFLSLGSFPGSEAGDVLSFNLAERGGEGWRTDPLGPPYEPQKLTFNLATLPVGFDDVLTTSLWRGWYPLTPDGPEPERFGFYRRDPDGSLTFLADVGKEEPGIVGSTSDARRLVFSSASHILPSDANRVSGRGIYELHGGTLRQVDVGEDGQELSTCGAEARAFTAVPKSGESTVFSVSSPGCIEPNRIFVWDGTKAMEASASRCTRPDCGPPQTATFVGMTSEGGSVYLVTAEQLVNGDTDETSDLYRFDIEGEALSLLTPAVAGANGEVLAEPVRAGAGGSRVYFYAEGRLLPGIGSQGGINLYLWQNGQLRFIDSQRANQPLQISRDGRYALLAPSTPLSGVETERELLFSFDGSDSDAGRFQALRRIGVDETTGSVYVLDQGHDVVSKFTPDGVATPFAATGSSSLNGAATPAGVFGLNDEADISVDNSGTASQGRVYVNADAGPVNAFAPDGSYLWQIPADLLGYDCGTAVDGDGHLWVSDRYEGEALEFAATSATPEEIGRVEATGGSPCRLSVDPEGNLYLNVYNGKVDKYVGGAFDSTLDPTGSNEVATNQSGEESLVFTNQSTGFNEFVAGKGLRTSTTGVREGVGIAYNPERDWVYVADAGDDTVKVFGPPTSRPASGAVVEGIDEDESADVYRYDAAENRLRLLSVGSIGGDGPEPARFVTPLEPMAFFLPPDRFPALNDDGGRVWFSTVERLLPEDENDAEDVYEWDRGSLSLISPGPGPYPAYFAGASADGDTVMFLTTRTLLPSDRDGGDNDLYAARIGGGFPEPGEPGCIEPCERQPAAAAPFSQSPTESGGGGRRGRLRIEGLPRALAAGIVRSGRTAIVVHAPAPGLLTARARGGGGILARGTAGATRAGKVHLVLEWSDAARAALDEGRTLKVRLRVSLGKDAATRRLTLAGGGGR